MKTMEEIISNIQWHAGLVSRMSPCNMRPLSMVIADASDCEAIEQSWFDLLDTLVNLNITLNGEFPSEFESKQDVIPRNLAYSIAELIQTFDAAIINSPEAISKCVEQVRWRISVCWSAVLAGDIDDIIQHLKWESETR